MTTRDVPLFITSTACSSERRITPSWTVAQLKTKLETITGIPPPYQQLTLRLPHQQQETVIDVEDEEAVQIGRWPLVAHAELNVVSKNPASTPDMPPLSAVDKYTMPEETYDKLPDTVRAFKKLHHIGRFDPATPENQDRKAREMWKEVEERNIEVGIRCRLGNETTRRGTVAFVGAVASLPGLLGAPWIGVKLDEPTGKNDGSIKGERYFQCEKDRGVFVRADRLEVGDFRELGFEDNDPEMEEI